MVRALAIADEIAPSLTEACVRDLAPDVVLSAGDLPWDYVEWVGLVACVPTVYVPGNHDPSTRTARPGGVLDADARVVEVAGLRIGGLGGCVRYRPGPHQYTQRQHHWRARRLLWAARRGGPLDVLLTHAPPFGLGDEKDLAHLGIEALHPVLERLQPTWHLHGHVHPFGRTMPDRTVGPTTIRNVVPWKVLDITPRNASQPARVVTAGD